MPDPLSPNPLERVTGDTLVCDLFSVAPAAREVFTRHGYKGCGGPGGPAKPVAHFAANHGVDVEQLLTEVRAAADDTPGA